MGYNLKPNLDLMWSRKFIPTKLNTGKSSYKPVARRKKLGGQREGEQSERDERSVRSTWSEFLAAGGLGGAVSPPTGFGAKHRKFF